MNDFITDEAVMMNVKKGNLSGMTLLFERYHLRLYNFFLKMGLSNDESQDLTQNLFYRMIKYRNSYREGSSVKSWIYQIARNLHTDFRKQQKKDEEMFFHSDDCTYVPSDSGCSYGEDEFERLNKAFSELSDSQKEILVLSRYQGLKYEEISKLINQSVPAIKVAVHRAIRHLRVIYMKQI